MLHHQRSSRTFRPMGGATSPLITTLALMLVLTFAAPVFAENWPEWRGPRRDGSSLEENPPLRWDAEQNVAWKTAIPGKGHASPIVWDDAVFIVTAIAENEERRLLRLDAKSGEVVWDRLVLVAPLERMHPLNSHASSTPATDGTHVYVTFLDKDKMFVAAYDFDGNKVWEQRPGPFASVHGYCSSPVIWKDTVILNGDHDGPGFLVALHRETGEIAWKVDRPNQTRSYCPPIIRHLAGVDQLIFAGSKCVASYNPDNGDLRWIIDGPTEQYVASLVDNGKYLFLTCGFPLRFMQAIRPDGVGNVTDTHVVWSTRRDASYVPSPAALGAHFIAVDDKGVATCLEADDGEVVWREDLGESHSASLITVAGLVWFQSDGGVTRIVRPGPPFELVAENRLGEATYGSPALSNGRVFLRSEAHLFCIASQ